MVSRSLNLLRESKNYSFLENSLSEPAPSIFEQPEKLSVPENDIEMTSDLEIDVPLSVDPLEKMHEILDNVELIRNNPQLDENQRFSLSAIEHHVKCFLGSLKITKSPEKSPLNQVNPEKSPLELVLKPRQPFVRAGKHINFKRPPHGVQNDDDRLQKLREIESGKAAALLDKENRKEGRLAAKAAKTVKTVKAPKRNIKKEPKEVEPPQKRVCTQPLFSGTPRSARASKTKAQNFLKNL